MYYIEKNDKPRVIERLFKIIKIQDSKLILPIKPNNNINEKYSRKMAIKTKKILDKTKSRKIVLSKNLKENEEYVNNLYTYGLDIIDGKWLFEAISCKVLDYIVKLKNIKKEETQISILVNYLTDYTLQNIKKIAKEYKRVNIVTNHIEKFKKVEEKLYNEEGIMLLVTNNKKKSLAKSNIILNIDFPKELLNKYNIYENAIIININGNMKIEKKRFNGITINNYEINVKNIDYSKINNKNQYYIRDLYEAEFYKTIPYKELINKINQDGMQIKNLICNNGII